jgi:hypothetical protein
MSEPIVLYRFRVRDEITGKIRTTRYHLTEQEALERYGDRLVERLDETRAVREAQEHRGHYPKG